MEGVEQGSMVRAVGGSGTIQVRPCRAGKSFVFTLSKTGTIARF